MGFCFQRRVGAKLAVTQPEMVDGWNYHARTRHGSFSSKITIFTALAPREAACSACKASTWHQVSCAVLINKICVLSKSTETKPLCESKT